MASFTTSQNYETVTLATADVALVFSCDDGGLRELRRVGGPNVLGYGEQGPSIDVQVGDQGWLADRTFVRYLSHSIEERDAALNLMIVIGIGPLKIYDRYRITGTLIARRVSVENVGDDELQLRGVRLTLPWARVGTLENCRLEAPGTSVRPHVPLAVAAELRRDVLPRRFVAPGLRDGRALERAPTHATGLLALHDPQSEETLFCWYYSTIETALPLLEGNDHAVTLAHEIAVADWLGSGVALSTGTQYIMLLREPWPSAMAALQRTWPLCGLRTLAQPAQWVRDAAIFETHAAAFGGFAGLAAALPELEALGINTLCLLPIWSFANYREQLWDGNWGASGDPYAIRDFHTLDPTLGTSAELRELVAAAHQLGLRVLLDLPLQGCAAEAPLVAEHPSWFCYDERGRLQRLPQQEDLVAFDWSHAELQEFMFQWAIEQLRSYDLDGYRLFGPRVELSNWSHTPHGHASASSLAVLRLTERLQSEMKWVKSDAALLGQLVGPVFAAAHDFTLDDLPHHMFIHMALDRVVPAELGEWLEDHTRALPPGLVRVCYVESHQTRLSSPLADGLRGSRISRMLLAGMVLCGFVPLIRSGQEREEPEFIGQLLNARATQATLRYGSLQYNALPCSSARVFTLLRKHNGEQLLGMLNVGAHKQSVVVSLPVDQLDLGEGDYELYDIIRQAVWVEQGRRSWRRDELLALRLTFEPFSAYAFAVRQATQTTASTDEAQPDGFLAQAPLDEPQAAEALPAALALGEAPLSATNGRRQGRRRREPS